MNQSEEGWVMLKDLRPGAVFVTREGIYAVKSKYFYANSVQCECVLLASGEYAQFRDGDETLVREVSVEGLAKPIVGPSTELSKENDMQDDRPSFLFPGSIERICREAYAHFTTVYGKRRAGTWEELPEKERTLVLDITGYVARTLYRKEQEGKAKLVTGPSTELSTDRDTHFAGFAKLLVQELQQEGLLETWNPDFGEPDLEKVQRATQLIAQRAYDLVGHTIDHLSSYRYDVATSGQDLWDAIPDLTKWPVEPI